MRRAGRVAASVCALLAVWGPGAGAASTARSVPAAVRAAKRAHAPFPDLTQAVIHVGGNSLSVVIAKTESQREEGLRTRSNLGSYAGMLFVFGQPTTVSFTMSTVPVPLQIGFYASNGRSVGRMLMQPCPRAEAACPVYQAPRPFRYALETLSGGLPAGQLSG
jgi:uncharacterized membrane protein (UPF0127 family)